MGGTWIKQDKILPGAYINILGETPLSIDIGSRGVVALPIELDWGVKGQIIKIKNDSDTLSTLGYRVDDIIALREIFKNAIEVLVCKTNSGTKAEGQVVTGVTATAICEGLRGNDINIVVQESGSEFDFITYIDGEMVDKQTITTFEEFKDNDYVSLSGTGVIGAATIKLSGGETTSTSQEEYKACLESLKTYNFNTLCYGGDNSSVKSDIEKYIRSLRENEGVKVQAVVSNYSCDYEGIIIVGNGVVLEDGTELTPSQTCYWVAGATAGANLNQSNTGKVYQGAIDVVPRLLKEDMEAKTLEGKMVFKVDNNQRVTLVYDINSLTTFGEKKKKSLRKNRVIRTLDNMANDISNIWEYGYKGKIDNNESGRTLYRGDLVEYCKNLQKLNAIENFTPEDITVGPGTDSDAMVVRTGVEVVDSAEKLYMTILV